MTEAAVDVLFRLADDFIAEGNVVAAAKCLEAVCGAEGALPAARVTARLRLAELLLRDTTNIGDAVRHIKLAMALTKQSKMSAPLGHTAKCHALLGEAYGLLGQGENQLRAYEDALAHVLGQQAQDDPSNAARWAAFFHSRTAEAHVAAKDFPAALEVLEAGQAEAASAGDVSSKAVFALSGLQVACAADMHESYDSCGDSCGVSERFAAADAALAEAAGRLPRSEVAALELHVELLRALHAVARDVVVPLHKKSHEKAERYDVIEALEARLLEVQQHAAETGGSTSCEWLPVELQSALLSLLSAMLLGPSGQAKPALKACGHGMTAVDAYLTARSVAGATLRDLSPHKAESIKPALVLKVLLAQAEARCLMLRTRSADAAATLEGCNQLLSAFAPLLDGLQASQHLMLGTFAHSINEFTTAVSHFQAATRAAPQGPISRLAAAHQAISELASGTEGCTSRAVNALGSWYHGVEGDMPSGDKCALHMASALVRLQQGAPEEQKQAKILLGKALKVAFNQLGHHQIIGNVLNNFAGLQFSAGDKPGAVTMLQGSSLQLHRHASDMASLAAGHEALSHIYASDQMAADAQASADNAAKYRGRLDAAVAAAGARPTTATLLRWGLT